MKIYVFLYAEEKKIHAAGLEALSYASAFAQQQSVSSVCALIVGSLSAESAQHLGAYSVSEVVCIETEKKLVSSQEAYVLSEHLPKTGAFTCIFPRTFGAEQVAARLAIRTQAAVVTGVCSLSEASTAGPLFSRNIYTNKAIEKLCLKGERWIVVIAKNAVPLKSLDQPKEVSFSSVALPSTLPTTQICVRKVEKASQQVSLPEADIVVSGGRGMKGPEHWPLLEELATLFKAALACSKPVSDMEWRPHYEHVGQTGLKISPSLYIAVGISGAVQHVAGINNSKIIVAINKDKDAPFFQAADYGIIGDAFQIIPKLIEAYKNQTT